MCLHEQQIKIFPLAILQCHRLCRCHSCLYITPQVRSVSWLAVHRCREPQLTRYLQHPCFPCNLIFFSFFLFSAIFFIINILLRFWGTFSCLCIFRFIILSRICLENEGMNVPVGGGQGQQVPSQSMDAGQLAMQQQMFQVSFTFFFFTFLFLCIRFFDTQLNVALQRAFLASAVQQNFQIQQQLMQQNQALQQLIVS